MFSRRSATGRSAFAFATKPVALLTCALSLLAIWLLTFSNYSPGDLASLSGLQSRIRPAQSPHQDALHHGASLDEDDDSRSWSDAAEPFDLEASQGDPTTLDYHNHEDGYPQEAASSDSPSKARLHLIIPASKPNPNLCKLIVSANVLGYPAPVLINWNQTFHDRGLVAGGSHIAKIRGVHEYLESLSKLHDDDLLILIDAYDLWLQLPPQTLIDRYFDINTRENARMRAEYGSDLVENYGLEQDIVFGVQKLCWPWSPVNPSCYAAPNSTLPPDVFGPLTDVAIKYDAEHPPGISGPKAMFRPRSINSGMGMGTVKGMRKLLGAALDVVNRGNLVHKGSDQSIIAQIYGLQQVWREVLHRDITRAPPSTTINFRQKDIDRVRAEADSRTDKCYEFNLGLDFAAELVLNTVFNENETAWLASSDTAAIDAAEQEANISPTRSILHDPSALGFPIVPLTPPQPWSHSSTHWSSWPETRLLTHLWTGIAPVAIHHNAHREGLKARRETWWTYLWTQPNLRDILNAAVSSAPVRLKSPVAVRAHSVGAGDTVQSVGGAVGDHGAGAVQKRTEYWAWKDPGHPGARDASSGEWLAFDDDLCAAPAEDWRVDVEGGGVLDPHADTWELIFGDGLGPWKKKKAAQP